MGEPDDEPPTKRVTPTARLLGSDTDVDVDSESDEDEGDSSILLENDDWVQVSVPPPLFEDINLPVNMANTGMAQDGTGQPPTAPATNFASEDGWLAPMKFTGTSSEDAQLWWSSFQLYKNFKELTDPRALAIFPLMLKDGPWHGISVSQRQQGRTGRYSRTHLKSDIFRRK